MKIATWNVNGIRAREAQVAEWVARERPDVICLQELKAAPEQIPSSLCDLTGYWCLWHGTKGYSGVGLYVSKAISPERPEFSHPPFDMEHRIVTARIGKLTVASVYVPNGGKDYAAKLRFFRAMVAFASAFRAEQAALILCGDFNIAHTIRDVHPKEHKPNSIGQLPEERELFSQLLDAGLGDVARQLNPDDDQMFSWWAPWRGMRQRNVGWRIDYILASPELLGQALTCQSFREVGTSDHAPVVAEFSHTVA
jgi:exodeoxyribonuclease III